MKQLLAAIRFLTILPIPGGWGSAQTDLAGSVAWFPVVGLLLGAVTAGLAWILAAWVPPLLAAALLVVALMAYSGCMHLDGLSDTADGMLSARPRDRILEIMKDSHAGAMGVIALVAVLLLKFAALASIAPAVLWRAAWLMPVAGRCAIVVQMALLPSARPNGLGGVFYTGRSRALGLWAAIVLVAAAWLLVGPSGLIVWIACLVVTFALAAYFYHKIGGATGDTFGAVCEIVEVVPAVVLAILTSWQGVR